MKMKRKYMAIWYDGHDYGVFEYYSKYKYNSKSNLQDAYNTYHIKYGYSHNIKIINISIVN